MKTMNSKRKNQNRKITEAVVGIAMFAALAYGVTFVFRIPVYFLTFDAKDAVITVASFVYGPLAGVIMSLLTALIELFTVSGTGFYGFVMNFVSSAVFAATASGIYKLWRNPRGAVLGPVLAVLTMTGTMLLMNLWITPIYMGAPRDQVVAMIPTLLFPFNLAKGLLNAALAMLLYKPLSVALSRAGLVGRGEEKKSFSWNRTSILIAVVSLLMIAAAVILFVFLKQK